MAWVREELIDGAGDGVSDILRRDQTALDLPAVHDSRTPDVGVPLNDAAVVELHVARLGVDVAGEN